MNEPNSGGFDVFIPENGFISLNVPLSPQRVGSHSTKTSHPHFLSLIQQIFDDVGIRSKIINPYQFNTKGEMLQALSSRKEGLAEIVPTTLSCGKYGRIHQQCGRCVPCIVRRSAFYKASIDDKTSYKYECLKAQAHHDDIFEFGMALTRMKYEPLTKWLFSQAPISKDPLVNEKYLRLFQRGLEEVKEFFSQWNFYD